MKHATRSTRLLLALAPWCLLLFSGCAPAVNVTTDYDRSSNFSSYQTFNWYQEKPSAGTGTGSYDTFLDQRMKNAIQNSLAAKGIRMSTSGPDLLVAYDVKVRERTEVDPVYTYGPGFAPGFGYGYGYWMGYRYNYGYSAFPNYVNVNQYREGTVIIDLVDAKRNELLWRGVGESQITTTNLTEQQVNELVTSILAKYPPGSGKKK